MNGRMLLLPFLFAPLDAAVTTPHPPFVDLSSRFLSRHEVLRHQRSSGLSLKRSAIRKRRRPSWSIRLSAAGPDSEVIDSTGLLDSLRKRSEEVAAGAGKRYRVRAEALNLNSRPQTACAFVQNIRCRCAQVATVVGFLNVHSAPDSPWRTDNVVHQLLDGDIVESVQEQGVWVCHDGGGWSVREHGGHQFLVPLE